VYNYTGKAEALYFTNNYAAELALESLNKGTREWDAYAKFRMPMGALMPESYAVVRHEI
jgi:hypothetical protein